MKHIIVTLVLTMILTGCNTISGVNKEDVTGKPTAEEILITNAEAVSEMPDYLVLVISIISTH
jgi:predicted small secreted protein